MTENELQAHCVKLHSDLSTLILSNIEICNQAEESDLLETAAATQMLETVFELLQVAGLLRQFNHEIAHNKK